MKYITETRYIDLETGEVIDKKTAKEKYKELRTKKGSYIKKILNYATRTYEPTRVIRYSVECTKQGRQLRIWGDT